MRNQCRGLNEADIKRLFVHGKGTGERRSDRDSRAPNVAILPALRNPACGAPGCLLPHRLNRMG